jgi:hypothetical protein
MPRTALAFALGVAAGPDDATEGGHARRGMLHHIGPALA